MTIAAIILLVLTIGFIIAAVTLYRAPDPDSLLPATIAGCVGLVMLFLTVWSGYLAIMPEYRLHRASTEKRILVEQAKAEADAAVEEARAEIERAKGTSKANLIVADSITEPYLRYLYINSLKNTKNQVIYLPTEAGLPILEAERLAK